MRWRRSSNSTWASLRKVLSQLFHRSATWKSDVQSTSGKTRANQNLLWSGEAGLQAVDVHLEYTALSHTALILYSSHVLTHHFYRSLYYLTQFKGTILFEAIAALRIHLLTPIAKFDNLMKIKSRLTSWGVYIKVCPHLTRFLRFFHLFSKLRCYGYYY